MMQFLKSKKNTERDPLRPLHVHLEELRNRLLICCVCWGIGAVFCFMNVELILDVLKYPAAGKLDQLAVFSPTAAMVAFIKIAAAGGAILTLPVLLLQTWRFIRPAVDSRSREKGLFFISSGCAFFMTGTVFSYFFILPASLRFLLEVGKQNLVHLISLEAYVAFALILLLGGGVIFEMPLLSYVLAKMKILKARPMLRSWRLAVLLILIAAALITPTPDVVNMVLMAIPMAALYGISIIIVNFAERKTW